MIYYGRDYDYGLKHYGVKGMKWGVRRAQSKARREKIRQYQTEERNKARGSKKRLGLIAAIKADRKGKWEYRKEHEPTKLNDKERFRAWDEGVTKLINNVNDTVWEMERSSDPKVRKLADVHNYNRTESYKSAKRIAKKIGAKGKLVDEYLKAQKACDVGSDYLYKKYQMK